MLTQQTVVRKNFEFDKRYVEMMERLKDVCGLQTEKSVIEEALVLFAWAASEAAKGHKVGTYVDNTSPPILREITTTALEKARLWKKQESKEEVFAG